jgi:PAS domain S-box-containing protein
MATERILVVEDNGIVLQDIRRRLEKMGYVVAEQARSGVEAIDKAMISRPDLVLMDIKLRGEMDGVEAATIIHERLDVPVVYLTAYADGKTLERAKITEPFGYIVKPFDENALHTNIQIAVFKHSMERKLRDGARWLSTTLNCIGDATVATDAAGRIRVLNPRAQELTGWMEADAIGRPWSDVLEVVEEGSRFPAFTSPEAPSVEGGGRPRDLLLIDKDGAEVPIELTTRPIADGLGEVSGIVMIFRDVSERKVAKEALEQSHHLLHLVLEGVDDIIFLKNVEGRYILMNRAGCRLLGLPEEDIAGRRDAELYGPGTAQLMARAHERAIEAGTAQTFECVISADGNERSFLVSESPCRKPSGILLGVVGIGRDITGVKVDRQPIHQRQKLATTGRAVGELAHEMDRSLSGIRENFQAIQDAAEVQQGYRVHFREIQDELQHIDFIVRQMSEIYWNSRSRQSSV